MSVSENLEYRLMNQLIAKEVVWSVQSNSALTSRWIQMCSKFG
jgi:hypothetical protein